MNLPMVRITTTNILIRSSHMLAAVLIVRKFWCRTLSSWLVGNRASAD
jgi:hypothetical protein